jgi:hypothetical protein
MSRFRWYRKLLGGNWYYNRFWFDLGRGCIFYWSRDFKGYQGGNLCSLYEEKYG